MSLTTVSMPPTTVTLSQCNSAIAVGDFLSPVRKSQIYQNIQIACSDGRLLENQLAVGLIFYQLIQDIKSEGFPDIVLIMLDYTVQEVTALFSQLYNHKYRDAADITECVKYDHEDAFEDLVKIEHSDDDSIQQRVESFNEDDFNIKNIDDSATEFNCDFCKFKSKLSSRLQKHIERMHKVDENLGTFTCENCKFTSNVHASFLRHKKTQCNQKLESCMFCDKKCKTKSSARKHRGRYHKQEWKEYKEGKKSITGQIVSKSHGLIPISEKSKQKLENAKAQGRIKVACEICAQLIAKDHLKKHLYNIHKQGSIKKPSISTPRSLALIVN